MASPQHFFFLFFFFEQDYCKTLQGGHRDCVQARTGIDTREWAIFPQCHFFSHFSALCCQPVSCLRLLSDLAAHSTVGSISYMFFEDIHPNTAFSASSALSINLKTENIKNICTLINSGLLHWFSFHPGLSDPTLISRLCFDSHFSMGSPVELVKISDPF